jgi:hypothetical protein
MKREELNEVLKRHALWLVDEGGARANLHGADLTNANMTGANLREANLHGASLSKADLRGASLSKADLFAANLFAANLRGANLRGADLTGASLSKADLRRAKGIISFGPVGDDGRIGYAVNHGTHAMVQLGCFWGTEKEALAAIKEKYGARSSYAALVRAACRIVMDGGK